MNAPQAQHDVATPGGSSPGVGVTVRAPRVLIANHRPPTGESADPQRMRRLLDTDGYMHPAVPAVIVYRVETGHHQQTGVVLEVSVEDYRNGRIRRHEATRAEREQHLVESTEASGIEQLPVMLTHPGRTGLHRQLTTITDEAPDVRFTGTDGAVHSVWSRHDPELARTVQDEVGHIEALYIADGHHRMAAAERYASRRSHFGADHSSGFTLATLFPSDEMRILGYHRCLPLPPGTSTAEVLDVLAAHPTVTRIEECGPEAAQPELGVVVAYLDGRYYRLRLRPPREPEHVRASLDVVLLDEEILPTAFGRAGRPTARTANDADCWCARGTAIHFLLHPPRVEQVMSISDAGLVMPPKSTWFAPKAEVGLFVRRLSQ